MKKFVLISVLMLLAILPAFSQDKTTVLDKNSSSIAVIISDGIPVGYGFFVSKDLLVTTINTIGKYKTAQVLLNNGKYYNILGYTASEADDDLVLLKTEYNSATPVTLVSRDPESGQKVFLIDKNNDSKLELADAILKDVKDFGYVKLLSIEASKQIRIGGLPVFDLSGNVIGMSVLPLVEDAGANFAIPSEKIEKLIVAQDEVKKLILLSPVYEDIKVRSLANGDKSSSVKEFLDQGLLRYKNRDYKGAIEKYNMVLRLSPNDADALVFRGQAKYMLLQYKDAMEDFNKAIVLQSEFAEAYDLRGLCKAELGDMDGACDDWWQSFEKGYDPAFKLLENFCDLEKMK